MKTIPGLKIRGRSFMALVLTPEAPLADWLAGLDAEQARASTFFVDRPVVLDLGLLGEDEAIDGLADELARRGIRLIATENAQAEWGALPAPLAGGRATGDLALPDADDVPTPARSLILDATVRSGQQIVHPEGDVVIIGGVASGAEVMAGGSIHIYGALRGRAVAGFGGNPDARIICRRLHAELLAIDGFYTTADDMEPGLVGAAAMARLEGELLTITGLE